MTDSKPKPPFDYIAHDLANEFPMMEGEEFEEFKANIKAKWLPDRIKLWDDGTGLKILDGRNRYKACKELGILGEDKFEVLTFATRTEAEHYVIALNLKRRHLNTQQKREYIKVQIRKYPALKPRALGKICQVSHMTVVSVMEEMRNPPDKKNYAKAEELLDELKKLIVGLSPKYQRDFAEEYGPWFRDVLEI